MLTCTFENNSTTSLRHIAVNTILIRDNQVLLGKRGTYKGKPILEYGKWGLLGGFLDRDETLMQGATREVMEESGWEIKDLRLLRINDNPARPGEDRQNVDIIFTAQATGQVGQPDEEIQELRWFDLDDIPPESDWAFDHYTNYTYYLQSLHGKSVPVII